MVRGCKTDQACWALLTRRLAITRWRSVLIMATLGDHWKIGPCPSAMCKLMRWVIGGFIFKCQMTRASRGYFAWLIRMAIGQAIPVSWAGTYIKRSTKPRAAAVRPVI